MLKIIGDTNFLSCLKNKIETCQFNAVKDTLKEFP